MRTVSHKAIPWGVAAIAQLFVVPGCGEKPLVRDADYPVYWNERIYKGEGIYCVGVGYTASEEGQPIRLEEPQGESIRGRAGITDKIAKQMGPRGWTERQIAEAMKSGQQIRAINKTTGNPAIRYVHPQTGQSVVVDTVTKEVIHVGGPGFKYGPASGDLP
jgi:hypothetical protein